MQRRYQQCNSIGKRCCQPSHEKERVSHIPYTSQCTHRCSAQKARLRAALYPVPVLHPVLLHMHWQRSCAKVSLVVHTSACSNGQHAENSARTCQPVLMNSAMWSMQATQFIVYRHESLLEKTHIWQHCDLTSETGLSVKQMPSGVQDLPSWTTAGPAQADSRIRALEQRTPAPKIA